MRIGKLSNKELEDNIFKVLKHKRKEILCRSSLSEDCASFKSKELLLVSSDPITGDCRNIGSLAIKVSTNDIFAGGGEPFLVMITLILPITESIERVKEIMQDAEQEAKKLNVEIAGGHTEFSDAVIRPIISATAIGFTNKHTKATTPKVGDYIIITKDIALEGTAIAIENYLEALKDVLSIEEINEGIKYQNEISIAKESSILKNLDINAMHDITEGGVFGAICEMCQSSNVGAIINVKAIPTRDITNKVCEKLKLDKYRLISSGSLMITLADKEQLLKVFLANDIKATIIGEITEEKVIIADFGHIKEELSVTQDQLFLKYLKDKNEVQNV